MGARRFPRESREIGCKLRKKILKFYVILLVAACTLAASAADAASLRSVGGDHDKDQSMKEDEIPRAMISVNGTEVDAEEYHRHLAYIAGYPGAFPGTGSAAAAAAAAGKCTHCDLSPRSALSNVTSSILSPF